MNLSKKRNWEKHKTSYQIYLSLNSFIEIWPTIIVLSCLESIRPCCIYCPSQSPPQSLWYGLIIMAVNHSSVDVFDLKPALKHQSLYPGQFLSYKQKVISIKLTSSVPELLFQLNRWKGLNKHNDVSLNSVCY